MTSREATAKTQGGREQGLVWGGDGGSGNRWARS